MFSHNENVHTIQLADGFFDSGTIAVELQRVMQAATGDTTFSVAYDPRLGKLYVQFMQSPSITMLGAESLPNSCMRALGFHRNKTTATVRLDADEILDLAGPSLCYHILINNETSIVNAVSGRCTRNTGALQHPSEQHGDVGVHPRALYADGAVPRTNAGTAHPYC